MMLSAEDISFLTAIGGYLMGPYPAKGVLGPTGQMTPKGPQKHRSKMMAPLPWSCKTALALGPLHVTVVDDIRSESMPILRLVLGAVSLSMHSGPSSEEKRAARVALRYWRRQRTAQMRALARCGQKTVLRKASSALRDLAAAVDARAALLRR